MPGSTPISFEDSQSGGGPRRPAPPSRATRSWRSTMWPPRAGRARATGGWNGGGTRLTARSRPATSAASARLVREVQPQRRALRDGRPTSRTASARHQAGRPSPDARAPAGRATSGPATMPAPSTRTFCMTFLSRCPRPDVAAPSAGAAVRWLPSGTRSAARVRRGGDDRPLEVGRQFEFAKPAPKSAGRQAPTMSRSTALKCSDGFSRQLAGQVVHGHDHRTVALDPVADPRSVAASTRSTGSSGPAALRVNLDAALDVAADVADHLQARARSACTGGLDPLAGHQARIALLPVDRVHQQVEVGEIALEDAAGSCPGAGSSPAARTGPRPRAARPCPPRGRPPSAARPRRGSAAAAGSLRRRHLGDGQAVEHRWQPRATLP